MRFVTEFVWTAMLQIQCLIKPMISEYTLAVNEPWNQINLFNYDIININGYLSFVYCLAILYLNGDGGSAEAQRTQPGQVSSRSQS